MIDAPIHINNVYLPSRAIILSLVSETQKTKSDSDFVSVLDELYAISENAVESLDNVSINKLPTEFLEMFLDIPGRRGGFCIVSPTKLVIFFDEDPNLITVIGKGRNKEGAVAQAQSKATQLVKLSFSKSGDKYEYKDNTGGKIDPASIVEIIINWVSSA